MKWVFRIVFSALQVHSAFSYHIRSASFNRPTFFPISARKLGSCDCKCHRQVSLLSIPSGMMTRSRKSVSEFQSSDQMINLQASAFQWPVRKLKNRSLQLKESEKSVEPVHDNLKNTRILDQKDSETDSQRPLRKKRKSVNKQRIKSESPSDALCSEVDVQDHVSKQLSSASTISGPLVQSEFDSPAAGIDSTMPRKRARKVKTERPVATEVEKSPAESNTAGQNEVRTTGKKKHTEPGSLAPPPGCAETSLRP